MSLGHTWKTRLYRVRSSLTCSTMLSSVAAFRYGHPYSVAIAWATSWAAV